MKIKLDTAWLKRADLKRLIQVLTERNAMLADRLLLKTGNYEALLQTYRQVNDQLQGVVTANAAYRIQLSEAQQLILGEEAHAAIIEKQEQAVQKLVSENISLVEQNNEFVTSNEQLLAENHRLKIALRDSEAKLTLITLGATQ